jgi:hypothetical protein
MKAAAKLVALFLAGVGVGTLPSRLLGKGANAERLDFQNSRVFLSRQPLEDGGVLREFHFEACGYLYRADAGQHYAEPCWRGRLDAKAMQPAVEAMLLQYDGGR